MNQRICIKPAYKIAVVVALMVLLIAVDVAAAIALPVSIKGVYLPAQNLTSRRIAEFIHYAQQLDLNTAVLHVKDPYGRIAWTSDLKMARGAGSIQPAVDLPEIVRKLKAHGIWTIAKLDVFADHNLVTKRPELGLVDKRSNSSWKDQNGLYWTNPYDRRVWDYVIGLAKEAAAMGFDEIQFDYIRFPSDGVLADIDYPFVQPNLTRAQCIGRFLEIAHAALGPLDVVVSVDVFGLVAWKREDFGVGQVLENIAPHVDVICPMFYPSHFPTGFLGKSRPGDSPREIMELSVKRICKRTGKSVRPWVQGFWYRPEEISAQIDGIVNAAGQSWTVWNPTGRYGPTYQALAMRDGTDLTAPKFYSTLAELRRATDEKVIKGRQRIVNLTDFQKGYSILSLETPVRGDRYFYATPTAVLGTLNEGVMDHILKQREIAFGPLTTKHVKKILLSRLLCRDLAIDARRLRPKPIFIDWDNDCVFEPKIPEKRLAAYRKATRQLFAKKPEILAGLTNPLNIYAKESIPQGSL